MNLHITVFGLLLCESELWDLAPTLTTAKKLEWQFLQTASCELTVFFNISDSEECGLPWTVATFWWMMGFIPQLLREEVEGNIYVIRGQRHSCLRQLVVISQKPGRYTVLLTSSLHLCIFLVLTSYWEFKFKIIL